MATEIEVQAGGSIVRMRLFDSSNKWDFATPLITEIDYISRAQRDSYDALLYELSFGWNLEQRREMLEDAFGIIDNQTDSSPIDRESRIPVYRYLAEQLNNPQIAESTVIAIAKLTNYLTAEDDLDDVVGIAQKIHTLECEDAYDDIREALKRVIASDPIVLPSLIDVEQQTQTLTAFDVSWDSQMNGVCKPREQVFDLDDMEEDSKDIDEESLGA